VETIEKIIRIASCDREAIQDGLADDVIDFVRGIRDDFDHEIHYMDGPSFLIEMKFNEDISRLAVLIKLVFGGVEVALV
jgi:hypothetical protein